MAAIYLRNMVSGTLFHGRDSSHKKGRPMAALLFTLEVRGLVAATKPDVEANTCFPKTRVHVDAFERAVGE